MRMKTRKGGPWTFGVLLTLVLSGCVGVLDAAETGPGPAEQPLAREILDATGVRGGLVVHLGCGEGRRTAALHASDAFLVHGLARDAATVEKARATIREKGLYGPVSVEVFDGRRLPYVDNLVNLVVAEDLGNVPMDEVRRVLAPGGVLLREPSNSSPRVIRSSWSSDIDQWTHTMYDSTGNAVAHDRGAGLAIGLV